MTDGISVKCGDSVEVFYQTASDDTSITIPEPAIVIQRYDQDGPIFGIHQGDQEIIVGGVDTLKRLSRSLLAWAKAEAAR